MPNLANRITKFSPQETAQLFKTARTRFKDSGIEIRCAAQILPFGRILFVIPRHVGNAVTRNLLRRRIKSIFYEEQLFNKGVDSILFARREATQLTFEQLRALLLRAFTQ